jgi:hypothetical protein
LNSTAKWTTQWFNKPKFHLLVHLVDHIRDFGPASLFATEAFESFNANIRLKSVHSNRQAPSRDIARAFAQLNRLRHLMSGGWFLVEKDVAYDYDVREPLFERRVPSSVEGEPAVLKTFVYRQYGQGPMLLAQTTIVRDAIGLFSTEPGLGMSHFYDASSKNC